MSKSNTATVESNDVVEQQPAFTINEETKGVVLRQDIFDNLEVLSSISAKIRYLAQPDLGISTDKNRYDLIAKILGKRIQYVLTQPLKKEQAEAKA